MKLKQTGTHIIERVKKSEHVGIEPWASCFADEKQ